MDPKTLDKAKGSQKVTPAPKDKKTTTKSSTTPSTANTLSTPWYSRLFSQPAPAVTEYDDDGLWTPGTETRTMVLILILVMGVLLLWPANDWRLPLIERFMYEVADDTITGLFIPAIPLALVATALGFFEIQILKKEWRIFSYFTPLSLLFGLAGLFVHVYFVYNLALQNCSGNPIACLWDQYNYDTIIGLWSSEVFRVSVVMFVFIKVECARFGIRYPYIYILSMIIFGTEFALPVFLMVLRNKEFKIAQAKAKLAPISGATNNNAPAAPAPPTQNLSSYYSAFFVINFLTWMGYIYRWANEFGSGRFITLTTEWFGSALTYRTLASIILINLALFVWTLPDIIADRDSTVSPFVVTWLLRFSLAGWFIGNTGGTLAFFLFLRENTKYLHFKDSYWFGSNGVKPPSVSDSIFAVFGQGGAPLGEFLSVYVLFFIGMVFGQLFPYHHIWFGLQTMALMVFYCHYNKVPISATLQSWFNENIVSKIIGTTLVAASGVLLYEIIKHDLKGDGEYSVPATLYYVLSQLDDITVLAIVVFIAIVALQFVLTKLTGWKLPRWTYVCYFGLLLVVFGYSIGERTIGCNLELGKEYLVNMEQDGMEHMINGLVNNSLLPARRLQHQKLHGCVAAEFIVEGDIPSHLKHGLFAEPKTFNSIVRYSNGAGSVQLDRSGDTRGMAIKVFDVTGDRLTALPGIENHTQDFVMISNPFFFAKNPNTYVSLLNVLQNPSALVPWIFSTFPPQFTTLIKAALISGQGLYVTNPLVANYYSTTPYRVGPDDDRAYKWSVQPCESMPKNLPLTVHTEDPNYLREMLEDTLTITDVCFDFMVQPQLDACRDPVEDPTVMWHGETTKIATLKIKRNSPVNNFFQQDYCQNMAFNPWNGIKEHQPLGNINKQRQTAYLAGYKTRMAINQRQLTEPSFEQFTIFGNKTAEHYVAGNVADYQYKEYDAPNGALPKYIPKLPIEQNFDVAKFLKVLSTQVGGPKARNITSFDDWFQMTNVSVKYRWREDKEFARQYIAGVNPTMLYSVSVKPLPAVFNTTDAAKSKINKVLSSRNEPDFDTLIKDQKIFFVDYEMLSGIQAVSGRVYHIPVVVFYLASNNTLLPLAIQLERSQPSNEVFTPLDREELWIFARMHSMHSDALVHEFVQHLGFTHLAVEPIIIAFYRSLPESHPLMQLMKPHFKQTLAINDFGRKTLLKPGGIFDTISTIGLGGGLQIMTKAYTTVFNITARSVPEQLRERGFFEIKNGTKDNLPGYLFRDDAFRVWNVMKKYITAAVDNHYLIGSCGDDRDRFVREDQSLRSLYQELSRNETAGVRGMPTLDSDENLIEFLTTVLWTASGQHSAVNFGQEDYYAFVPNRPFLMTKLMPADKSQVTWDFIISALPNGAQSVQAIKTATTLSLNVDAQLYPGTAAPQNFQDIQKGHVFAKEYTDFLVDLQGITKMITNRNDDLVKAGGVAYPYLNPSQIAASIAI